MKLLVSYYSYLQNPWLGGYRPQIPVLSVLCPQLNLLNPPPQQNSWVRHCCTVSCGCGCGLSQPFPSYPTLQSNVALSKLFPSYDSNLNTVHHFARGSAHRNASMIMQQNAQRKEKKTPCPEWRLEPTAPVQKTVHVADCTHFHQPIV